MKRNFYNLVIPAVLLGLASFAFSQDEKKDSIGGSLGDLFDKVKDIKVPDSVANLPSQLTDLKKSYLETAKTVEELKVEVGKLRSEVAALRSENADLRKSVGAKVKANRLAELMKPVEVSASDLVATFAESRVAGNERYKDRYLKVVGSIVAFKSGSQTVEILLRADGLDTQVCCSVKRDANFHVEVLPTQGRLISRNDRRTLLSVGQPVAILGTCTGATLNVELSNCKVAGLEEKRKLKPVPQK